MAEGFDLSDIPLTCDSHSDFDSTSELQGNSGNSQSHDESKNSVQNLSHGDVNSQIHNESKNSEQNLSFGDVTKLIKVESQLPASGNNPSHIESENAEKNFSYGDVTQEKDRSNLCEDNSEENSFQVESQLSTSDLGNSQSHEESKNSEQNLSYGDVNSQSHNESKHSENNLSFGDLTKDKDKSTFYEDDWEGNSFKVESQFSSSDYCLIQEPKETDSQVNEENSGGRSRTEEEMMLREFDLLDEVGPYDENEKDSNFCDDESENDCDDLSEDEIDAMLEERLEQPPKKKPKLKETQDTLKQNSQSNENKGEEEEDEEEYLKKDKTVLVEKVKNHFEVLPDGWVKLTHNSGMPLYLHRASRVCTLSKPYSLGTGSARKHAIPLSAIPCLEYRRAKEDEEKRKNSEPEKSVRVVNGTEIPHARIETAQENESSRQLTPEELTEYCKSLFEFETIQVFKFKSWLARRKFKKKSDKIQERPTLPKDTKLITCMIKQSNGCGKSGNTREWIINPNGKSYVCILHEYVQRVLKDQPVYTYKELENTATPYLAAVSIGNIQYGTGYGSSKKQAKHEAAKATLEILIPEMKEKIDQDEKLRGHAGNNKNTDLSFFDGIKIEDPRVTELCAKTTEPLPHEILLTCLQRNFGLSQMNIKYETTPIKNCRNVFTMTVGNHTAKVICRNKRDGKQKASQAILQALHPHVPSWGSLLRLYGNTSVKTVKEKKIEEQEITLLQNRGNSHSPNYAILNKLKEEMKKFKAMKSAIKPIGKFVPPDDIELPAESGSDLSNVLI